MNVWSLDDMQDFYTLVRRIWYLKVWVGNIRYDPNELYDTSWLYCSIGQCRERRSSRPGCLFGLVNETIKEFSGFSSSLYHYVHISYPFQIFRIVFHVNSARLYCKNWEIMHLFPLTNLSVISRSLAKTKLRLSTDSAAKLFLINC